MEAASRPDFEPLADLPVEEPLGMGLPSGRTSSSTPATTPVPSATAAQGSSLDFGDDLLSHGALLDLGADAPGIDSTATAAAVASFTPSTAAVTPSTPSAAAVAPFIPHARPDTSLVPTLSSASSSDS